MALFKILHGDESNISLDVTPFHEGWAYISHSGYFYVDLNIGTKESPNNQRIKLNSEEAERLTGYNIATILNSSDVEIPTSKAVFDALLNKSDIGHTHETGDITGLSDVIANISDSMTTNYNESIIGLSIDGQIITYIKGDGSTHTIVTQDTNTTYSLGTDTVTGLTKLYATTGSAEDGTLTQKAITDELNKKVSVSIDGTQNMLVFTI